MNNLHPVGPTYEGEKCSVCKDKASHKVGEEMQSDHPRYMMHNWTTYLCCRHFWMIMGPVAEEYCRNVGNWTPGD